MKHVINLSAASASSANSREFIHERSMDAVAQHIETHPECKKLSWQIYGHVMAYRDKEPDVTFHEWDIVFHEQR